MTKRARRNRSPRKETARPASGMSPPRKIPLRIPRMISTRSRFEELEAINFGRTYNGSILSEMRIWKYDALKYVVRAAECLLEPWKRRFHLFSG